MPRPFSISTDAAENRWKWGIIAALLLLISLPYAWAVLITPNGLEYRGLMYNPDDQNVHLAWARQAAQGHFFFRDLFTTESLSNNERPLFTNLYCWALGVLSFGGRIPIIWLYHLSRLLFAALAMHWFHALCVRITGDRRIRVVALGLAAFSMGGGWLREVLPGIFGSARLIDRPDLSLMMPEAFTFSSAFIFPLYIASMALLTLVYLLVLRAQETGEKRFALGASAVAFLLTNIHTYDAIPLNITLMLWAACSLRHQRNSDRKTRMAWLAPLAAVAGTIPPFLYQIVVFRNSTEFQIKAVTPTLPPGIIEILLSYAPLLLFAIPGVFLAWRFPRARLMLLWTLVTLTVIYAPVSFGRKMIEGVHLPICFLAAVTIVALATRLRSAVLRPVIAAACILPCCFSTMFFTMWCIRNVEENNVSRLRVLMPPLYLTTGDAGALRHLAQPQYSDERAVLCLSMLGNYVPGATGKFVYSGHWAETLNFAAEKHPRVLEFYLGRVTPDAALRWLHDNHIGYIIVGHYEKALVEQSGRPSLPQLWEWQPIYNENGTAVYRVPPERNANP